MRYKFLFRYTFLNGLMILMEWINYPDFKTMFIFFFVFLSLQQIKGIFQRLLINFTGIKGHYY